MSQGNYNAPPPKSGGMSTVMIVLIIFAVLGLICVGACGFCIYSAQQFGNSALKMGAAQLRIEGNQQIEDKFGTPLQPALPSASTATSVDYDLSGPKGKGKVHAEFKTGGDGMPEPTVIKVTAPDGTVIDALAPPPVESPAVPDGEMPDDAGATDPAETDTDM